MNALDVLRVLRRHPLVLALLLILSIGAAGLVYRQLPINYQSTASQILLPSNSVTTVNANGKPGTKTIVNPYKFTGDNPSQITASTLVTTANGSRFKRALKRAGVVSSPSVAISGAGGGVVIDVAATATNADNTRQDLTKILAALETQLKSQQRLAGAPEAQWYGLAYVNPPDVPSQVTSGRFKTAVIAGVLGVIVTLIIILIYDAQLRRRQPRGRRRTDGPGRASPVPYADGVSGREAAERTGSRLVDDRREGSVIATRKGGVPVPDRDAIGPRAR